MQAGITTLDDRLITLSANEAELSWHMFGGPLLANLPGEFSETDVDRMRMADLEVFGRWGGCWGGLVTACSTTKVEGGGKNLGLSIMRDRGWPICINQTTGFQSEEWAVGKGRRGYHRVKVKKKGWVKKRDDAQNATIATDATNDAVTFTFDKDATYWSASTSGMVMEIEPTTAARVTFAWSRSSITYTALALKVGTPATGLTDGDRWTWVNAWTQAQGTGSTSGTATVDISGIGTFTALQLYVYVAGSYVPSSLQHVKFSGVKVYGTAITSATPAAIVGLALDEASDLVDTSSRVIATEESALEPFDTDGTPLDLLSFLLTQTGGQFAWLHHRTRTGREWRPTYSLASDEVRYEIYAPESDLSGVDIDECATHAEVSYSALDGGVLTLQRSTTDGYLAKWGVEKWIHVDATHTTSPTQAAALGDLALAEAAYDRHAGTVQVEAVRDLNGNDIPLEHLVYGPRVKFRSAGKTIYPRLIEGRLSGGVLDAALDDSKFALDVALANLARR